MSLNGELLRITLLAAVPLWALRMKQAGGPSDEDYEKIKEYAPLLGHRGDVLLYGGSKKKGEVADLFNGLAHAIAVLSFTPGGVDVFGEHWETTLPDS